MTGTKRARENFDAKGGRGENGSREIFCFSAVATHCKSCRVSTKKKNNKKIEEEKKNRIYRLES